MSSTAPPPLSLRPDDIAGRIGEALPAPPPLPALLPAAAYALAATSATPLPALQGDTLDEPVSATILRDVRAVSRKLRYVLLPASPGGGADEAAAAAAAAVLAAELREWDLWGPLLLCLALSVLLSWGARKEQAAQVFAAVFVAVWAGAAVVAGNAQLLGGRVSFFQAVCVLGYCLCPLLLAGFAVPLVPLALFREVAVLGALGWSVRAAFVLMSGLVPAPRRALALYPVALFYLLLAYLVYLLAPDR